jgi:serine/threonine protein kinase
MEFCAFNLGKYNEANWTYGSAHGQDFIAKEAWNITMQVLGGLVFIHSKKFAHRDLKPRNSSIHDLSLILTFLVLFSRKDRKWKISDFGFTSECSSNSLQFSEFGRGTPGYRAPEVISSQKVNAKADIWALGCIL